MSIKKMHIRITKDGNTEIHVIGGEGEGCMAFTKAMEQALGQVQQRELTDDYHRQDTAMEEVRDHVGITRSL